MKKFFQWYLLLGKAQLKRVETYAAVIAIAVLAFVVKAIQIPSADNLKVGIFCESPAQAVELIHVLKTEDSIYDFVLTNSLSELKDSVKRGEFECGFSLHADYKETFEKNRQDDICDYYCGSFTTKGEVAKETIYIALMKIRSAIYLDMSLSEIYKNPSEELRKKLNEMQEAYLNGDELLQIHEEVIESDADVSVKLEPNEPYPIQGSIALLLFVVMFLHVGEARAIEKNGYGVILRASEKISFALAKCLAAITIPFVFSLALIHFLGENPRGILEVLYLLLFVLYAFLWCYFLYWVVRKESRYQTILVPALLLTILICPIYIEMANYFEVLKYVRLLFPTGFYLFF